MVQVLPTLENQGWNKRVESTGLPCLDEGSIPSSSTDIPPKGFHPREGSFLFMHREDGGEEENRNPVWVNLSSSERSETSIQTGLRRDFFMTRQALSRGKADTSSKQGRHCPLTKQILLPRQGWHFSQTRQSLFLRTAGTISPQC